MTIGDKIFMLRKARGMNQEQLAQALEVSRQAVSKWELNEAVPDVARVVAMSELFGVTTDYLLKDSGGPSGDEQGGTDRGGETPEGGSASETKQDRKWFGMTMAVISAAVIFGMWAVEERNNTNYWVDDRYVGTGLSGYLASNGWALLFFLAMLFCLVGGIRVLLGKPFRFAVFTGAFWKERFADGGEEPSDGFLSEETRKFLRDEEPDKENRTKSE